MTAMAGSDGLIERWKTLVLTSAAGLALRSSEGTVSAEDVALAVRTRAKEHGLPEDMRNIVGSVSAVLRGSPQWIRKGNTNSRVYRLSTAAQELDPTQGTAPVDVAEAEEEEAVPTPPEEASVPLPPAQASVPPSLAQEVIRLAQLTDSLEARLASLSARVSAIEAASSALTADPSPLARLQSEFEIHVRHHGRYIAGGTP